MFLVVAEEVLDGVPDDACRGAWTHDDVEEVDGDGAVYPGEDGEVVAAPRCVWAGVGGGRFADDMGSEAIAAEGDEEEFAPAGVVGVVKAEGDWDVKLDGCGIGCGVWARGSWRRDEIGRRCNGGGGVVGSGGGGSEELLGELVFAGVKGTGALVELALLGRDFLRCHGGGKGFRVWRDGRWEGCGDLEGREEGRRLGQDDLL